MINKKRVALLVVIVASGLLGYGFYCVSRPLADPIRSEQTKISLAGQPISLPWPSEGQAALTIVGTSTILTHNDQIQKPIASVAKVMTALTVLDKLPLKKDESGPLFTMTAQDVALYDQAIASDGSTLKITKGEVLSERQMLEALMLPSANNIADSLAINVFGSIKNYTVVATKKATELGMKQTIFSDASGFSPQTVSTPHDLVLLGQAALDQPALSAIVSEKSIDFPGVGTINNVNYALSNSAVDGIKTGNTDQAGGCFLFSAPLSVDGMTSQVRVVGAIMSTSSLHSAIDSSLPLINALPQTFEQATILPAGTQVASYVAPWGQTAAVIAPKTLTMTHWKAEAITTQLDSTVKQDATGMFEQTASLKASSGRESKSFDLLFSQQFTAPAIWWRLLHPAG